MKNIQVDKLNGIKQEVKTETTVKTDSKQTKETASDYKFNIAEFTRDLLRE